MSLRQIVLSKIGGQVGCPKPADACLGAEDRPPDRLFWKCGALHQIEDEVVGAVVGSGDLLLDDDALFVEIFRG